MDSLDASLNLLHQSSIFSDKSQKYMDTSKSSIKSVRNSMTMRSTKRSEAADKSSINFSRIQTPRSSSVPPVDSLSNTPDSMHGSNCKNSVSQDLAISLASIDAKLHHVIKYLNINDTNKTKI